MRGKDSEITIATDAEGITPAYAGKRMDSLQRFSRSRDHPCVCGEKMLLRFSPSTNSGSPLRMRGKVALDTCSPVPVGITPAYAGKRQIGGLLFFLD